MSFHEGKERRGVKENSETNPTSSSVQELSYGENDLKL